jgi:hypothetical protein
MQESYRSRGEEVTLDEALRRGREMAYKLDTGKLELKAQHDHTVGAMFISANESAFVIASEMTWLVVHAPPGTEFILSDHPVLIHDAEAGLERGAGWLSSEHVEARRRNEMVVKKTGRCVQMIRLSQVPPRATVIASPFIPLAASLTRKAIASATSSADTIRPAGDSASHSSQTLATCMPRRRATI